MDATQPKRWRQRLYQSTYVRLHPSAKARQGKPLQRGVALIMVLLLTTLLSAMAADLQNAAQVNLRAAANSRDALQAYFHARSAVELELFLLRFQDLVKGSIGKFLPIPLFELSGVLVSSDILKSMMNEEKTVKDGEETPSGVLSEKFGDFRGSFLIDEVVDENRKLNLNLDGKGFGVRSQNLLHGLMWAVFEDPKYDRLFESLGETRDAHRNRIDIIANITDWMDGDEVIDPVTMVTQDNVVGSAPEDSRYERMPYGVRYGPKDGMMNSLAELRMVPYVNDAFMRLFARYFTVWGDRAAISMQTADVDMQRAIINYLVPGPPLPSFEQKFKKYLEVRAKALFESGGMLKMNSNLFQTWMREAEIQFDPQLLKQLETKKVLRYDDDPNVYRITAVGRVDQASVRITTVWRPMGSTAGEFLYWRED